MNIQLTDEQVKMLVDNPEFVEKLSDSIIKKFESSYNLRQIFCKDFNTDLDRFVRSLHILKGDREAELQQMRDYIKENSRGIAKEEAEKCLRSFIGSAFAKALAKSVDIKGNYES